MRHIRTNAFKKDFVKLPRHIQEAARDAFKHFEDNPSYPSLRIEQLPGTKGFWSGRITDHYRWTFQFETDPATGERICIHRQIGAHDAVYENP